MIYEPLLLSEVGRPAIRERAAAVGDLDRELADIFRQAESHRQQPLTLGWKGSVRSQIDALQVECVQAGWNGEEALPISPRVVQHARFFVHLLPAGMTEPKVIPSVEGGISFEWRAGTEKVLSISIVDESIVYAAILGPREKHYGENEVSHRLPPAVSQILAENFSLS